MTAEEPALPQALRAAMTRLAGQDSVLIGLDFDGCVAELVADAHLARPVPENAAAIDQLATLEGVRIAYVSGRPLETLRELASPPEGTLLIGSHGAEKDLGPDSAGLQLTPAQEAARTDIINTFERIATEHEGAWVEHKPAGAALHVRHIDVDAAAETVLEEARASLAVIDEAHLKEGKKIVEAVVVHSTKGEALAELRELTGAEAAFFAGDDVTDEHGFAVLRDGDVGVKVGPGDTAAEFRIGSPAELAGVLEAFTQARRPAAEQNV